MLKERWDEMTRAGRDWAVATALTLTPLLLAVVRLFVFSRGDLETLTTFLVNLNLVSFVTSSMVAFLPYALLATAAWFALWPVLNVENFIAIDDDDKATLGGSRRITGVAVFTSLALLFGSLFAGAVVLGTGAILAGAVIALRRNVLNRMAEFGRSGDVREATAGPRKAARVFVAYTFVAYAFVAVFYVFGIGYPAELVQIKNEPKISAGYVLSVDDVSLTLAYAKGGVRRIPIDSVERRVLCPVGTTELDVEILGRTQTVAQMIFELISPNLDRPPTAECAIPASSIASSIPAQ